MLASLAAVSSAWVVDASQFGRDAALGLLALSALALLWPRLGTWLARPWVRLGERLDTRARRLPEALGAWALGFATGLLWAPCAGPILGLILSGAMLQGPNASTSLALFAYGLGSACALGLFLLCGRGLYQRLRPSLPRLEHLRRLAGGLALLSVVLIASGQAGQLPGGSSTALAHLEQHIARGVPALLERLFTSARATERETLPDLGPMPSLAGASQWLNSPPLDASALRGKVLLVDFWTYDCSNCQHSLPYVNDWARRYAERGLLVIGVHTPEYPYERILANVRQAVQRFDIHYPVAVDDQYRLWNAFGNQYWPAHYLIDANGRVRLLHVGEGDYAEQERAILALLQERDAAARSH
ncbi:MAG: Protein DipZ [Stenotrophomonas maltophilia]|nr:MAG: Protein DipZ [Stenotrophomonas maltophilia]